ncbi:MAG: hypothetical protein KGK07_15630 [Chloroflexota bacterium]|nr:hypothetical protein [Chloroflexota bacterium]
MTVEDARKLVGYLAAAYPRQAVSGETVAVFIGGLGDANGHDAWEAARSWTRTSSFLPSLAELLKRVAEARDARTLQGAGDAALALPEQAMSLSPQRQAKSAAFRANLRAWAGGAITTGEMLTRATEIETETPPVPPPAEVEAAWAALQTSLGELRDPDARVGPGNPAAAVAMSLAGGGR